MPYFAELDKDNTVLRVLVADAAFIATMPGTWVETTLDGSIGKNYAGIGHAYDADRKAFIAPKPYPSWVLDEATCRWQAPLERPIAGDWEWDEAKEIWVPA